MEYTREPIIETIITPKEGYKLMVRNSKGNSQEEYSVDAIEIVSFGNALFFRSQERPKSFLLPVSDYEVVELRETRAVLKAPAKEKTVKIGGGKEAKLQEPSDETESPVEKKRGRRHGRKRKTVEDRKNADEIKEPPAEKGGGKGDETRVSSSTISRLLPPPPGLISETLSTRQKDSSETQEDFLPPSLEEESPTVEKEKPSPEAIPVEEPVKEEEPLPFEEEEKKPQTEEPVNEEKPPPVEEEEKKPQLEEPMKEEEPSPQKEAPPPEKEVEDNNSSSTLSRVATPLGESNDHFTF